MPIDEDARLWEAAHAVASARLSDAFGHVSIRTEGARLLITPARPLAQLGATDRPMAVDLDAGELPPGTPGETWIHLALLGTHPEARAVCRAQPPAVAAAAALDRPLAVLNGHAAVLGEVATHLDSRLVRDATSGAAVARSAGTADVVILRGNGAVTLGANLGEAVARMWLLERSAELNLRAWAAGQPQEIPTDEQQWWRARSSELLPRIFDYLRHLRGEDPS